MIRNLRYTEFLKIVNEHPEWKEALSKKENEVGETSLRVLLAVLTITGLMPIKKARLIVDVLGALLIISLYFKKNVLDDPKVREFLVTNLNLLNENGKKYFEVIYNFFENKVKAAARYRAA